MDKETLLAKYRNAFTQRKQEIANVVDASFISGKLHSIKTFSEAELDVLAELMPPQQNIKCVELLREADELDKFTKFSAAILHLSPDKGGRLFPFVSEAPRSLHPSYRTWQLRGRQHKLEKTHLLVLTTNPREFECAVMCGSAYQQVRAKEEEELWGDVNIFNLTLGDVTKRVVIILVWERRFLPSVLDAFAPQMAILSVFIHTSHLPRMEAHGRVWKDGDAVLVESVQVEGCCMKAHQRIHELKLWNLLKWESEVVEGSCEGQGCQAEARVSRSLELELLSEQLQTLNSKKMHHMMLHPLYPLPLPQPTPLRLHFAPFERIEAVDCREGTKEWMGDFYHAAEQRRPEEKRGKVGDMPVFFCLGTLRRAERKGDLGGREELMTPLVFQLLPKVVHYFYIDAKQPPPS